MDLLMAADATVQDLVAVVTTLIHFVCEAVDGENSITELEVADAIKDCLVMMADFK